jgi:hypothetical protein
MKHCLDWEADMELAENILELHQPNFFQCSITNYRQSHGVMIIELQSSAGEGTLYLGLLGVQYFEGPLNWFGANMCFGTKDECIEYFNLANPRHTIEPDIFMRVIDQYRLFKIQGINYEIKILAGKEFEKTTEDPYKYWLNYVISAGAQS